MRALTGRNASPKVEVETENALKVAR